MELTNASTCCGLVKAVLIWAALVSTGFKKLFLQDRGPRIAPTTIATPMSFVYSFILFSVILFECYVQADREIPRRGIGAVVDTGLRCVAALEADLGVQPFIAGDRNRIL